MQHDPLQLVFGFGRRICPGQYVAEATVFIQMATFLAVLNISKAVDSNGRPVEPNSEFTTAIVRYASLMFVTEIILTGFLFSAM